MVKNFLNKISGKGQRKKSDAALEEAETGKKAAGKSSAKPLPGRLMLTKKTAVKKK